MHPNVGHRVAQLNLPPHTADTPLNGLQASAIRDQNCFQAVMNSFRGPHNDFLSSPVLFDGVDIMKKSIFSLKKAAILVGASMLSVSAFSCNTGGHAAVFYEHAYGGGRHLYVDQIAPDLRYPCDSGNCSSFNDIISSICVAPGRQVVVLEDILVYDIGRKSWAYVTGNWLALGPGMYNLWDRPGKSAFETYTQNGITTQWRLWNDRISAIMVVRK